MLALVILDGDVLIPNSDYDWNESTPPHTIRFRFKLRKDDVIQFVWLAPEPRREIYVVTEIVSERQPPTWTPL